MERDLEEGGGNPCFLLLSNPAYVQSIWLILVQFVVVVFYWQIINLRCVHFFVWGWGGTIFSCKIIVRTVFHQLNCNENPVVLYDGVRVCDTI